MTEELLMYKAHAHLVSTILFAIGLVAYGLIIPPAVAWAVTQDQTTDPQTSKPLKPAADQTKPPAEESDIGGVETHLWLAEQIQQTETEGQDEKTRQSRVDEQIEQALAAGPLDSMAHLTLGAIYERRAGRLERDTDEYRECLSLVIEHFQASTSEPIDSVVQFAATPRILRYRRELNEPEERVAATAKEMVEKIRPFALQHPNQVFAWKTMIECATLAKQYDLAKQIVREGFVTSSSNEVRKQIAQFSGLILLLESDEYSDMTDDDAYRTRLDRLCGAISVSPKNPKIYSRLLEYVTAKPVGFFQSGRLERALATSKHPGTIHTLAGFSAAVHGTKTEAQAHWKIAQQQYTLLPVVLTNLLQAAIQSDAVEFADPLPLFDVAIDSSNHKALLLQMRGWYYRKQGRNEDAINDLERAVDQLPNLVEARQLLINVHTELGNSNEAAKHQQRLNDYLDRLPDNSRVVIEKKLESVK